jgi:transglutaminase-like putative cysteine protease
MASENRLTTPSRWLDWASIILLISIFVVLTLRLAATGWVSGLIKVQNILPFACMLGIWVGFSRFSWRVSVLVGVVYGLIGVTWLIGNVFQPNGPWIERIKDITLRLADTWRDVQAGHPAGDTILFYGMITVLVWIFAYSGAFLLVRKGIIWPYLIPSMILFLLIDRFDLFTRNRSILYLVISLLAIIAIARSYLIHKRKSWYGMGTENIAEAEGELTRITILLTLAFILSIALLPGTGSDYDPAERAWRSTSQSWGKVRRQLANIFAPLRSSSSFSTGVYTDELNLGTNANQSDSPALEITSNLKNPEDYRFYWRARSYDKYEDGVWTSSSESLSAIEETIDAQQQPDWKKREQLTFYATVYLDRLSMLYTEQNPHETSVLVEPFYYTQNSLFLDVDRLEPESSLLYGASYAFSSDIARPGAQDLLQADPSLPENFPSIYLQLPDNFPARMADLANRITQNHPTTYEKTQAVIDYLRTQMQYQPSVEPSPRGRDPIDYFLFDTRSGFCNYYASAAVLLLRSAGIPSRMVVGFSQGEYDATTATYTVRMKDSHAWPEVYFNNYGWIPFEPTSNQASLVIPNVRIIQPTPSPTPILQGSLAESLASTIAPVGGTGRDLPRTEDPGVIEENAPVIRPMWWVLPAVIGILLLLYLMIYSTPVLIPIYQLLNIMTTQKKGPGDWFEHLNLSSPADRAVILPEMALLVGGIRSDPANTPRERFQRWQSIFPQLDHDIRDFAQEYEQSLYSNKARSEEKLKITGKRIYQFMLPRMIFRRVRMKW